MQRWWIWPVLLTLAAMGVGVLFVVTQRRITGGVIGAPLDDAWIHLQFARNLSHGHGFSYNPGQPTPGSTAPLWTLLLALPAAFTDQLWPALALSAFFYLLTLWLTYGFVADVAGRPAWGVLAALGLLLTGRMQWAALSGMEATAFAALSLAAMWGFTRHGWRWWTAALFGLASQLRPEGHALFALALAWSVWRPAGGLVRRQVVWAAGRAGLIYGAIAAPYILFSLSVTGRPLPNTFYAKAGGGQLFSLRTLAETLQLHAQDNPIALALALMGLGALGRRSPLAAVWLVTLPLFTALLVDLVWHHGRYTLPLIPLQLAAAALGLQQLAGWLRPGWRPAFIGVSVCLFMLGGAVRLPHWAVMLGRNVREIELIDVALGRWLAANTPPDALIAVDDIGAMGYLSGRRLLDLNGLISPEMWPVIRGEAEGRPRNEAAFRLLSHLQPDYLAIFPNWHFEIAVNPLVATPQQRFWVDTHTIIGEQEAVVYRFTPAYLTTVDPQVSLTAHLGEGIELLGYDASPTASALALTLYWRALAPVQEGYDVFVHILDDSGAIVAQADRQPVDYLAPTYRWRPGDIVRDPYVIPLPQGLPAGGYRVQVGMFVRATLARLPVSGLAAPDDAIPLLTWEIPQAGE